MYVPQTILLQANAILYLSDPTICAYIVILSTLGTVCRRIKSVPAAAIFKHIPAKQNIGLYDVVVTVCGTERRISYTI